MAVTKGSAKNAPWSGWWWPTGYPDPPPMAETNGPLDKFDQYIKKKINQDPGARQWELSHHYSPGCGWCGHCHGWAAASILEYEPVLPIARQGTTFTVGDLKGLLTEVHCRDALDLWQGKRGYDSNDDELEAHVFHQVLLDWVGNGEPVVMDKTKKPEVWNHPVYKFEMTSQPDSSDPNKTHVTCTVWYVSDGVGRDHVGTVDFHQTYKYWITGSFQQPSGGDWEENSQSDHPGFIWHPDYVNTTHPGANPAVKFYHPYIEDLVFWARPVLVVVLPDLSAISSIVRIILDLGPIGPISPLLFRGLVALDPSEGYALPAMAASWSISEDALTYVFHLRDGVTFHDGAPLTAEDVAFTYRAMMDPDLGSSYQGALMESIADVEVSDEHTVAFRLKRPMTDFPAIHGWHWILPQHVIEEEGWEAFAAHPVGSGPFAFESWEPGNRLTLTGYPDYSLGKPRLSRITFLDIPGIDVRLLLLIAGSADIGLFDYTLELERRAQEVPHLRTFAIPPDAPTTLEIQNIRVKGRIPNAFDGGWDAHNWDIDFEAESPSVAVPVGPLRRRLTRGERKMSASKSDARFPEWREGVWWQIQVRQRNVAARVPDPGWALPFRMLFEVIGEEVVGDKPCYHIRVTYPDRPRMAEQKYADIWVSKDERIPVHGTLHIGDRTIPMRYDFLMELLKMAPVEVDTEGIPRTLLDPRWPDEEVELRAFETRTPTGGVRLSSPAAPFPVRIDEPDYIVELQDWGG